MGEQGGYQIRFDWGVPGAHAVGADADVLVWVDAIDPAVPPLERLPPTGAVVTTGLAGVAETAAWVLALQEARQAVTSVAVVAAGAARAGGMRFAAEDLLVAGALMDELDARGIGERSPEASVADAAYRALRRGLRGVLDTVVGRGVLAGGLRVHRPHRDLLEAAGAA
jgi:2-phosphosulfolactate phosphatase